MLFRLNMHGIDSLRGVDLNLLVTLDALLPEVSVTLAARRLGLSQSATSHALARLREQFGDPLLVRGKRGMSLTPRALGLQSALRAQLSGLASLLDSHAEFEPAALTGTFRLVCEDSVSLLVLPRALKQLGRQAPMLNLSVVARPLDLYDALERAEVDLAFGTFPDAPATTRVRTLYDDEYACLVRRGLVATKRLTLRQFASLPHAVIAVGRPGLTAIDRALADAGHSRRVALRIHSFLAAPFILSDSDLVLTVPRRLAETLAQLAPLELFKPPITLAPFRFQLAWHARHQADPAHRFVRRVLGDSALER